MASTRASAGLRRVSPGEASADAYAPVDQETLDTASAIVEDVRSRGEEAVRHYAMEFGERTAGDPLVLGRDEMEAAYRSLPAPDRDALTCAAERVRTFARAQRDAIRPVTIPVPGGEAGHTVEPVARAGCYAPAGRYPLPSSALMTAITARVAGCERVVVASPGAPASVLGAAWLAEADEVHAVGGAHAIAALATGALDDAPCDVVVGPGNRFVTAAKQLLSGRIGIDMLAGPSELVVLADDGAQPAFVAADLLAQAEHDTDARAILVTTSARLAAAVDVELAKQLETLDTRDTAREALRNGFCCVVGTMEEAIGVVDTIAPEHLEVMCDGAPGVASRVRNAGAVFIGPWAAEVIGDYAVGPNHTLPTGGTARFQGGLSVIHFLRLRTWIRIDDPGACAEVYAQTAQLAKLEGLTAHAAAANARLTPRRPIARVP